MDSNKTLSEILEIANRESCPDPSEIKTLQHPIQNTSFRSGDLVYHRDLGTGVIIGFTSYTGAPKMFSYKNQEYVVVNFEDLERC